MSDNEEPNTIDFDCKKGSVRYETCMILVDTIYNNLKYLKVLHINTIVNDQNKYKNNETDIEQRRINHYERVPKA